ncbi:MAG: tetraacyldisaccharide 4'-kinase [Gemmatimonadetes bacterium]|nr:tetraacyldisaccharide 4'-kinase [Gemmatimonadota bacterium]
MPTDRALAERLWHGDDAVSVIARAALAPVALVYGAAMAVRSRLFDAGVLASRATAIPAISIGNLSVGGTGKTPVAAWFAASLRDRGAHPAIVLRGYGEDEPLVHRQLNPDVPVVTAPDRVAGAARARGLGADVAVLDDAFQHRGARRMVDVVLVSADAWPRRWRLLPAGPMREPLGAVRRATLAIVTRKSAASGDAEAVLRALGTVAPRLPVATVHLPAGPLRNAAGEEEPLEALAGRAVLAIASIAAPGAFGAQLAQAGARPTLAAFADHHEFSEADVSRLVRVAGAPGVAVCTLKDHVKLAPLWPRGAPPLWYVTQRVRVETGHAAVDAALDAIMGAVSAARSLNPKPAPGAADHGHRPPPADR